MAQKNYSTIKDEVRMVEGKLADVPLDEIHLNHTIEMTSIIPPVDPLSLDPFIYSFVQPSLNKFDPKTVVDEATTVLKMEVFAFLNTLIIFYLLKELAGDGDQVGSVVVLKNYVVNEQGVSDRGDSDVHRELDSDRIMFHKIIVVVLEDWKQHDEGNGQDGDFLSVVVYKEARAVDCEDCGYVGKYGQL